MSERSHSMRAEMLVGLDLKIFEDLRIFNGYETLDLNALHSIDSPASSPDQPCCHDDGDCDYLPPGQRSTKSKASGSCGTKPKCGRPANPIPRHKRESHIKAEYKRRDKIQKGFDTLMTLVPALSESTANKESKSAMLFKTAEYCRRLKSEHGDAQSEMTALREELESLGSQIHELQDRLPKQGASVVDKETLQMDALYNEYVQEETKKNWKFWIFGFFMKPLYKSYRTAVTGSHNSLEVSKVVIDWVKDCMSLASLRKGFLDSLRKLSTRTEIMTSPDQLPQEARTKMGMHCVLSNPGQDDDLEVVYRVTPAALTYTPRTTPKTTPRTTPKETPRVTPVPTPSSTPPRTPTSTRRSKRRESRLSKESRSRSNSPNDEGTRLKRRPSNRSEKRHYSGDVEDDVPMLYTSAMSPFSFTPSASRATKHVTPVPLEKIIPRFDKLSPPVANRDIKNVLPVNTGYTKSPTSTPFQLMPQSSKVDDKLATTFIGTLTSFLQSRQAGCQQSPQISTDQSSTVFSCSNAIMSFDHQPPMLHEAHVTSPLLNDTHLTSVMENSNDSNQSVFMPVERSGLITNNSVLSPADQSSLDTTSGDSLMPELSPLSYDNYTSVPGDNISVLGTSQHPYTHTTTTNTHLDTYNPELTSRVVVGDGVVKQEGQQMITNEDESLMKMLTFDVMDVNCVMNFFGSDNLPVQTKVEKSDLCCRATDKRE